MTKTDVKLFTTLVVMFLSICGLFYGAHIDAQADDWCIAVRATNDVVECEKSWKNPQRSRVWCDVGGGKAEQR